MNNIVTIVMLIANMLPAGDQGAIFAFAEEYVPEMHMGMPVILNVYDPALGGINCDDDCSTVATGKLKDSMYEKAGACPVPLLGATIHFDDIGMSMLCVDTGGLIGVGWSERDQMYVVYMDILWHLDIENKRIVGAPAWNHWLLPNWRVTWEK